MLHIAAAVQAAALVTLLSAAASGTDQPCFPAPSCYSARVPATLDLAERARLALHALVESADPATGYVSIWWGADIARNPPVLFRPYGYLYGKFAEALPRLRLITGPAADVEVDRAWAQELERMLSGADIPGGPLGVDGGRYLAAAALHYAIEQDPRWRALGENHIRRIQGFKDMGEYGYFEPPPTGWGATFLGWGIQGLTEFYKQTSDPLAGELTPKLAHYLKDHAQVFDAEGHFLARHDSARGPALHFHHNANALEALSEYGLVFGDAQMLEFVRKGYEWARTTGSLVLGFFPEYIQDWPDDRGVIDCETCAVADMILLAVNLSRAGIADYWDDVDRCLRNQFAEMQITSTRWISRMVRDRPPTLLSPEETSQGMPQRLLGDFAGWAGANDWFVGVGPGIMHCCLGNASRALYAAWRYALEFKSGVLRVNLLLNRASPWADLDSYIPYSGRVDIRLKQACQLLVRVPEWASPPEAACEVNGHPRSLKWSGRYANVGQVEAGDLVTVSFPIGERTVSENIGGQTYTLIIRGNDVVSIQPQGTNCPFYQRARYRTGRVRWRTVARCVAAQLPE